MKTFDLSLLNIEQREAIEAKDRKILCLAGAGTGKTRTLVLRIQRLLNEGIKPSNILCLTFTRLAGLEMKLRVGDSGEKIFINTFHSFCHKVIEDNIEIFNLEPNFTVLTEDEKESLVKTVISDLKINTKPDLVDACLYSLEPLPVTNALNEASIVAKEYRYRLLLENAIDMTSLLVDVVRAFNTNEALREKYHNQFSHVFVDELQDTDDLQMSFLKNINPDHLFMVGDDYQSIYGFRNAKVEYIINLSKDPKYKVYELNQNYRSTDEIVSAAQNLISYNKNKTSKGLFANKFGEEISYLDFETEEEEIAFVVETIKNGSRPASDYTIIGRTNKTIEKAAEILEKEGIPSRILGKKIPVLESGTTRKYLLLLEAIKGLDAKRISSQILGNFYDSKVAEEIQIEMEGNGTPFSEILMGREDDAFAEFIIDASVSDPLEMDVEEGHIFMSTHMFPLSKLDSFELSLLSDFIKQWKKATMKFDSEAGTTMRDFLNWMKTRNDADVEFIQRENYGAVTKLATAHSSKGLEFPVVFLIGMNEEYFPIIKPRKKSTLDKIKAKKEMSLSGVVSDESWDQIEEERRLAFVAITRAEEKLYVTRARKVKPTWSLFETKTTPSRFISEMKKVKEEV